MLNYTVDPTTGLIESVNVVEEFELPEKKSIESIEFAYKGISRGTFLAWKEEEKTSFLRYLTSQFYNLRPSDIIREFGFTAVEGRKVLNMCNAIGRFSFKKGRPSEEERESLENLRKSKIIDSEHKDFIKKQISRTEFLSWDEKTQEDYVIWITKEYPGIRPSNLGAMINNDRYNCKFNKYLSDIFIKTGVPIGKTGNGQKRLEMVNSFREDFGMETSEIKFKDPIKKLDPETLKKLNEAPTMEMEELENLCKPVEEPVKEAEVPKLVISSMVMSGRAQDIIEKLIDNFGSNDLLEITVRSI